MTTQFANERAIEGWAAIADFFAMPMSTMLCRRKELMACGAIFYRLKMVNGKKTKAVYAFPSSLKTWQARKTIQGERV